MDRRDFLQLSALAAASLVARPAFGWEELNTDIVRLGPAKKILILGAGLAGLTAGYELSRAGHEVTILEGQLRAGGRVQTLREPFSDGLFAEAGPARIPDSHHLTLKYVKQFGLELDPFYPTRLSNLVYARGKRVRVSPGQPPDLAQLPYAFTEEERKLGAARLWSKYYGPALAELRNPESLDLSSSPARRYDALSLAGLLSQRGASSEVAAFLSMPFQRPDEPHPSALWVLRITALLQTMTTFLKIRGGTDLLPRAMAARLTEQMQYGAKVVRMEQHGDRVRVIFERAGARQALEAAHVICTIPFSVLRDVEVDPPFSPEKTRAIRELNYEPVARVFLQTRTRYWEREGLNGFGISDLPEEIWHPTHDQPGPRGILLSYMFGEQGHDITRMKDDEARIRFIREHLDPVLPGLRENFEGGATKIWQNDPWARGAVAYPAPGQMIALIPHTARPEGRIHFAGEHTSPWTAWMQGAIESGLRAGREVNDADAPAQARVEAGDLARVLAARVEAGNLARAAANLRPVWRG
ncbi:MAG: FAD-dependent oxidoreductase [Acidobacteria bacterium]|nr:FAD-dependent oxidoreductase [Acidobacteriota bacterium]